MIKDPSQQPEQLAGLLVLQGALYGALHKLPKVAPYPAWDDENWNNEDEIYRDELEALTSVLTGDARVHAQRALTWMTDYRSVLVRGWHDHDRLREALDAVDTSSFSQADKLQLAAARKSYESVMKRVRQQANAAYMRAHPETQELPSELDTPPNGTAVSPPTGLDPETLLLLGISVQTHAAINGPMTVGPDTDDDASEFDASEPTAEFGPSAELENEPPTRVRFRQAEPAVPVPLEAPPPSAAIAMPAPIDDIPANGTAAPLDLEHAIRVPSPVTPISSVPSPGHRFTRPWRIGLAAAATLLVVVVGGLLLSGDDDRQAYADVPDLPLSETQDVCRLVTDEPAPSPIALDIDAGPTELIPPSTTTQSTSPAASTTKPATKPAASTPKTTAAKSERTRYRAKPRQDRASKVQTSEVELKTGQGLRVTQPGFAPLTVTTSESMTAPATHQIELKSGTAIETIIGEGRVLATFELVGGP